MLRAIIFDMDDVVINSRTLDFPAWQQAFLDLGKDCTYEEYKNFLGMKSEEIIGRYFPLFSEFERQKYSLRKQKYFLKLLKTKGIKMTTGLVDFLKEAKGNVGLAIATSASQVKVDGILDYLDFRAYFEV